MPKGHRIGARLRLGAFYIALRAAERRILKTALSDFEGNVKAAAEALGIKRTYFDQRAIYLGGVYDGQPVREPPGKLATARYDARAAGVDVRKATWKLRRFGKELKRKVPDDDNDSNGIDPSTRIRSGEEGAARCGTGDSSSEETAQRGEDRSERSNDS